MNWFKKFSSDRTARTIMLAVILIILFGMARPDKSLGLYPDEYWAHKAGWKHCANIVLAGDSRVLMGLSPSDINDVLGPKNIYNYGFGSSWWSAEYLQAVESMLDPCSTSGIIIMGISPHSLTTRDSRTGNFHEVTNLSNQDRFMNIHFGEIMYFFQPLSFSEALEGIFPSLSDSHSKRVYYPNGWISMDKVPPSTKQELRRYRGFYQERQVDDHNIRKLIDAVNNWRSQGIAVYGFVPPSCNLMYQLEAEFSGFEENAFIEKFEQAGGIWLRVDQDKYESFDGSHLKDISAIAFSKDLAKKIKALQKQ